MKENSNANNIIEQALIYATEAHKHTFRKGTSFLPYILHPVETAIIASTLCDDPDIIAAALLHDILEDTKIQPSELEELFGEHITSLVLHSSEDKRKGTNPKDTWYVRKNETIHHLKHNATHETKILALSDKLSNLRSSYNNYLKLGDSFWNRFNEKDPSLHFWYNKNILDACSSLNSTPAYKEYSYLIDALFNKHIH